MKDKKEKKEKKSHEKHEMSCKGMKEAPKGMKKEEHKKKK